MKPLALLALPIFLSAADRPELAGNWTSGDALSLRITQKGSLVRISQTSKTPGDERTLETECKTDGRFHPVVGPIPGSVKCKWEGRTLVSEKELSDGSSKLLIRFTVDLGGATATETLHMTGTPAGDNTLQWTREK